MIRGSLSAPQISMTVGELEGWSICWGAQFECKKIIFSDGRVLSNMGEGIWGNIAFVQRRRQLNLAESSVGICSIFNSADKKYIERLFIEIFENPDKIESMSKLLISGEGFNKFNLIVSGIHSVDADGNHLPDGTLYWELNDKVGVREQFFEISSITLSRI